MVTAKVWVLKRYVEGRPKLDDFSCIEEELPECKDGDVIVAAEYITVDPYIRYRLRNTPLNTAVAGGQVARVIESKNSHWPVGSRFVMYPGWRTHTYVTKKELSVEQPDMGLMPLPDIGSQPTSTALGVLGMPGNTAYFGFLELCQPQRGDTVLVNGAAGAVGSVVVQIAKIKGCRVIAFAGSDEKVAWAKEIGADFAFNYNTTNVAEALKEAAPLGINCYFDNVGGSFTAEVVPFMANMGRIAVCGAISIYNQETPTLHNPFSEVVIITKQLRIEGFLVYRWLKRWHEGINQLREWVEEGKIKIRETKTSGFENTPSAFIGLFSGSNIGKAVIKV